MEKVLDGSLGVKTNGVVQEQSGGAIFRVKIDFVDGDRLIKPYYVFTSDVCVEDTLKLSKIPESQDFEEFAINIAEERYKNSGKDVGNIKEEGIEIYNKGRKLINSIENYPINLKKGEK